MLVDKAELIELSVRLRNRLTGEPCDATLFAHMAGLWLEPRLGAATLVRGRVLVYDPSARASNAEIERATVRFLLREEGFDDECGDVDLAALADMLIVVDGVEHAVALNAS